MRGPFDLSTLILIVLAIVPATIAYAKDPGLPLGAGLPSLIAYMTAWSLFGLQRIIAWEAPLLGWKFAIPRVASSFAFPVLAGWLVATFYRD